MFIRLFVISLLFICLHNTSFAENNLHKIEKAQLYTIRLDVPKSIMSIVPLKNNILNRFKSAENEMKKNADEIKTARPDSFSPLSLETQWQVIFENDAVISIVGTTYEYQGGAHPNSYFETIVWDKKQNHEIILVALFKEDQANLALKAIANSAQKSWANIVTQRSGEKPSADLMEQTKQGITSDAKSFKNYALTHAKGKNTLNGIELLYGAGEVWPHVMGEFRISVPLVVFEQYLKPNWKSMFLPK